MTARDEAIEAVLSAGLPNRHGIAAVIDAIPPDLLPRLAIEQDALIQVDRWGAWAAIRDAKPLYRVVEP